MIENIKTYVNNSLSISEYVNYKGLKIYPVKVKDYYDFIAYSKVIDNDKRDGVPLEYKRLTYLQYMFDYMFNLTDDKKLSNNSTVTQGDYNQWCFINLLCMVLHIELKENTEIYKINHNSRGKIFLIINGVEIKAKDFDELRKIILHSNIATYRDKLLAPEIQKVVDEYAEIESRKNGGYNPTIEEQASCVTLYTGLLKKDLINLTYREFSMIFSRITRLEDYKILKGGEMSGIKFEKAIPHWIYSKPYDIASDAFTNDSAMNSFVNGVDLNKK